MQNVIELLQNVVRKILNKMGVNITLASLKSLDCWFNYPFVLVYTQSPITKNGPIRNDSEILGKFKERTLSKSKLRNAKFASK